MNNYQGAAAIYTGLSLPPISRLDQTWKNLDLKYEKLPSIWSDIQSLFRYSIYRERDTNIKIVLLIIMNNIEIVLRNLVHR